MTRTVPADPEIGRIDLPADLAELFHRVGDRQSPPQTLNEGFAIIRETLDEGNVDVSLEDMYQDEPTRHAVHVDGNVEHVPCVLDAMIVALSLEERPIEIHSEPPTGGEPVQFRVTDGEVTVTPDTAIASFGIGTREAAETNPANVKAMLNEQSTIPTTCSVTNAFPDPEAYTRWAADVSEAAVMHLEIEELVAFARRAP